MPRGVYARTKRDPLDRFIEKVEFADSGCWEWTGWTNGVGYGKFYGGDEAPKAYAYRWIYERLVEPIPEALTIDHLCRNPICVNPDHLEVVTQAVNIARGTALDRAIEWAKAKTHCPQGHEYTEANTYIYTGVQGRSCRMCRECSRLRMRDRRRKAREE